MCFNKLLWGFGAATQILPVEKLLSNVLHILPSEFLRHSRTPEQSVPALGGTSGESAVGYGRGELSSGGSNQLGSPN